ncbi:hypothetical protein CLV94_2630 [Flavobacterium endophyticum]|uniref:Uncharacterized protein n=1 Tax=Flavobacterium endophyticum TaxID=1540163 RepID=A0A495MB88_9FLAO|nr:hypothetical protein CLV94_2630 [Flavobacterium endophyticum]
MNNVHQGRSRLRMATVLLVILLLLFLYWFIGTQVNVYDRASVGAVFEILWFPAVVLTFFLPIFSAFQWYRDNWNIKSIFLLIVLLSIALLLWLAV